MGLFSIVSIFLYQLFCSIIFGEVSGANRTCQIYPFQTRPAPLIVYGLDFLYPNGSFNAPIYLKGKQKVSLVCPGGNLVLDGRKRYFLDKVNAKCIGGDKLLIENIGYKWRDIKCSKNPVSTIKRIGSKCGDGGKEYQIGFEYGSSKLLKTITICFNEDLQTTLYSQANLIPLSKSRFPVSPHPQWKGAAVFGIRDVNKLYSKENQRRTINNLLDLFSSDRSIIQDNDYYLTRGQLIAANDFLYEAQRNSTFHLMNVLPRWQTLNTGNWKTAEIEIHEYAVEHNVELKIWAGGHGVITLPRKFFRGEQTELYLYNRIFEKKVPVPAYFWRVVYNPLSKRGVALISVNNPYKTRAEINVFCTDISYKLKWLTIRWDWKNLHDGFSWACDIDDFRRTVRSLPKMPVRGLLL